MNTNANRVIRHKDMYVFNFMHKIKYQPTYSLPQQSRLLSLIALLIMSHFHINGQDLVDKKDGSTLDKGLSFNINLQESWLQNFNGGIKTGSGFIGRVHFTMNFDTEKAGLWKGGAFKINAVNAHGGTYTDRLIGDFQPISRNEASERTGLFEFWYKQTFGKVSILFGQHDQNSIFGTSQVGGQSVNSAFGMNPSLTPNAGYSFSIYPRTMPGLFFNYDGKSLSVLAAIYAGSSLPYDQDPYNVKWNWSDSQFIVGEIHYKMMVDGVKKGHYKIGMRHHTGGFPSIVDGSTLGGLTGFYVIADQMIHQKQAGKPEGIYAFGEFGTAAGDQNLAKHFIAGGLLFKGMFPKRAQDQLFLGILNTALNTNYLELQPTHTATSRTTIEMNYALKIGKHITFTPDIQYIINPDGMGMINNAFLGLTRLTIDY